jgi:hypothetical protein
MFKKPFRTDPASVPNDASTNQGRGLGSLRKAYADWRFGNDLAAIVAAFDRLSNRRLNMIGLHREALFDSVGDMMVQAEEERAIVREIIAIIDASTDTALTCPDIPLPEEFAKQTEAAATKRYT